MRLGSPSTPAFLGGESVMARLMREKDWTDSPLGDPKYWPEELRIPLSIGMHSSFPTAIYWGPDLRLLYNDAWMHIPAERHPWCLGRPGREVWADIWDTIGPQFLSVMTSGEGLAVYDQPLAMMRKGRIENTYWNYSFTPILFEDGSVAGIFNQGHETTKRVVSERDQLFLLDLADSLRGLDEPRDITDTAQRMLGEHLRANRVGYGEVEEGERYFTTLSNWTDAVPPRLGTHDLTGFGPQIHDALRRGDPLIVRDVLDDHRITAPEARAAFAAIDTRSAMTVSLVKGGRMAAALYVHARDPRHWAESDVQLVRQVAERTWAAVGRARAEAVLAEREADLRRIFDQTSDIIITADLDQRITDCNPSAAAAVGMDRESIIGMSISQFVSEEGFAQTSSLVRQKLERGGTTRHDVQVRNAQGEWLSWEINSGLTYDDLGHPIGLHVVGRDVSDRRKWEGHQRLLVGELNHRVKNTLSIVQSLAHQSFSRGADPKRAIAAFEERLLAVARAHNLLTQQNWESVLLQEIVEIALAPFCGGDRCRIDGPELRISPKTAVSIVLGVHELATNASKYGALSTAEGRIDIRWKVEDDRLHFTWTESGGPTVAPPSTTGFGTRMLTRGLASELGGKVDLEFAPGGVVCRIAAPIPLLLPDPLAP